MERVLHLIDSAGMYGAEKVVLTLLEELKFSKFPGTLGCIRESVNDVPKIAEEAINHDIQVVFFTMKRGFNLFGIYKIYKYIMANNIKLVHSHGYKPNIFLGLFPKRKIKKITTVHGWSKNTAGLKTTIYEYLDSLSIKRMNAVIAVSRAVINDLSTRKINNNKIYLIYNGINTASYKIKYDIRQARKKYDLESDDYVLGSVGRLTKVKGHDYLIEAVPAILKEIKNCKVIIAGDGPLKEQLTKLIYKYNLSNNIKLIGYSDNVKEILAVIDLFILPSLSEGLPISLLEAMASGKPSIASGVGGITEVILDNVGGIVIPPHNSESINDAVIKLYRDEQHYKKLKEEGIKVVEEKFSTNKMVEQYINIYSNLSNE